MRYPALHRVVLVLFALALATGGLAVADNQPPLTATYSAENINLGPASVNVTFTFTLTNHGAAEIKADNIKLSNMMKTETYATFDGGTISPGGQLSRTKIVVVPGAVAKGLKEGQPASLFVKTLTDNGSMQSYVAAHYSRPNPKK